MQHSKGLTIARYAALIFSLLLIAVLILNAAEKDRRYYAELVGHDSITESTTKLGGEWLTFNENKIFYRFSGIGLKPHVEQITGTVVLRLGGLYRIFTDEIKLSDKAVHGEEPGNNPAIFEGEYISGRRHDLNDAAICLIVTDAELMRCMSKRR